MEEMDGEDIKLGFGEEDVDLRCVDSGFIPLPLLIGHREIGHKFHRSTTHHLERWGEESFVHRQHTQLACQIPPTSKATFFLAFSPDGTKVASSHGDHNIYVTEVKTGSCICTLKGHPRSPWCVAFHPSSNEIIASGCLGGEVRVWDLKGGSEVWTPDKKGVGDKKGIASLAFHPTDQVLVIATNNEVYFWNWFCPKPFAKISTPSKLERVKYVAFDPLGYKLITGIAILQPDRLPMDSSQSNSNSSYAPTNSETSRRNPTLSNPRCSSGRMLRVRDMRSDGNQGENSSSLSSTQRASLLHARNYAQSFSERPYGTGFQETGTVPGPSSLSEHLQDGPSTSSTTLGNRVRRFYPLLRGSHNALPANLAHSEDETRIGGEFRLLRPVSDDSASSSSLDSSSSVTSGVSRASHERNTRLSLLWTSRLNRAGGGNESDNSAGGNYDLEERRGEGCFMRGATRGSEMRLDPFSEEREPGSSETPQREAGRERDRELRHERGASAGTERRGRSPSDQLSNHSSDRRSENNEDDSDLDSTQRGSRHSGQGGRWMYYRGKFPGGLPPSRSRGTLSATGFSPLRHNSSRSSRLRGHESNGRHSHEDLLAVPGPSGLSQNPLPPSPPPSSSSHRLSDPSSIPERSSWLRSQNDFLDPQFGVQLLSRHIENMQTICRSLYIPRAELELTRNRNEISQLEQIHSMLYEIQHQIRSLRASVDQTISGELAPVSDESLNSASVNPEPLGAELLDADSGRNLQDQVELEVNIGSDDVDQYSYSTLAEEDPDQLSEGLSSNPLALNNLNSDSVPSVLDPTPAPEPTPRPPPTSSSRVISRILRYNSSRALRSVVTSRAKTRRIGRNRLVWTGLLRRLPSQRRSIRSRLPLSPQFGTEATRSVRRRDAREARGDKRRNPSLGRRTERSNVGNSSTEGTPNGPEFSGGQRREPVPHVRRRHSGDWQRRLRSILALDEQRQREGRDAPAETHSSSPSLPQSSFTTAANTADSTENRNFYSRLNELPSSSRSDASTTPQSSLWRRLRCASSTLSSVTSPRSSSTTSAPLSDLEEEESFPERVTRAGPPTTSLSYRIATMVAQQYEARNRTDSDVGLPSQPLPRIRAGGTSRLRYDLQRLSRRNYLPGGPFPPPPYELDSSNTSSRRSLSREGSNGSLRNGGGDLAAATLAAIDPDLATEQERQRESFRQERRESYRHILQLMANRLHRMMTQSLSRVNAPLQRGAPTGRRPLISEEEEAEAMEMLNLRPSYSISRRMPSFRGSSRLYGSSASSQEASAAPPTVDRHMHNLRLLVRVALHLIYQLLNFICNPNLSYEERPISRLPNPFREGTEFSQQNQSSSTSPAAEASSNPQRSFEMDIEPGLHNLTTLLETVRMASEELSHDAMGNGSQSSARTNGPESRQGSYRFRSRRNHAAYSNTSPSTPEQGVSLPATLREPSASMAAASSLRNDTVYSGTAVRRRLTDLLIRTGGHSQRASSTLPNPTPNSSAGEGATASNAQSTRRDLNPGIQRPLPITPTVHLRDIRAPLLIPIPQILLNDMRQDDPTTPEPPPERRSNESSSGPSDDLGFYLRTFGGIPLRLLGRQNAVDRHSPDSGDSSGNENNNNNNDNNNNSNSSRDNDGERSFSWYASPGLRQPFRHWNPPYNGASNQNPPLFNSSVDADREGDQDTADPFLYFSQSLFSHYHRSFSGLYDFPSPNAHNNNSFYRIQAWDFKQFEMPDLSDSHSNIVVSKCRIQFDASVSISVDGTLLAAVLPDYQAITRIGVYSLETKTLGQLLFRSFSSYNIISVSFSPTMKHIVVGSSSQRLPVHQNEKQVIGRIYKLCHSPSSVRGGHPGNLKFCRTIELQRDIRASSLNCIRWIPIPGQGLVYGTNQGQVTVIR